MERTDEMASEFERGYKLGHDAGYALGVKTGRLEILKEDVLFHAHMLVTADFHGDDLTPVVRDLMRAAKNVDWEQSR
jgi:hypothetical protein